jgi:hypothetical protein
LCAHQPSLAKRVKAVRRSTKCEGGPVAAGYGWQAIETDSAKEGFLHLQDSEWPT